MSCIPHDIRRHPTVNPLPRNVHPEYHKERRAECAKSIERGFQDSLEVVYVDAAEYATRRGMSIVAVDADGHIRTCGTVRASDAEVGKESVIALAIASTNCTHVASDSKAATRNFARGRISPEAQRILAKRRDQRAVQIIWAPAHTSLPGNEAAHTTARGLAHRAIEPPPLGSRRDRMVTYQEITGHYRLGRLRYSPPHTPYSIRSKRWPGASYKLTPTQTRWLIIITTRVSIQTCVDNVSNGRTYHIFYGLSHRRTLKVAQ